jgi:polar amino acid transport system substrate-binding protein
MRSLRTAAAALAVAAITLSACTGAATAAPATPAPTINPPTIAPSVAATSSAPAASPSSAIAVPPAVVAAGKLVWCVDISYPPEEFYAADGSTAQGSDIDIATEIGKRFGVTTTISNTGFDGIIPALLAKKCDAIISGMNDTPTRATQVDFIDYLKVGQGILVPAGNPKGIHTLADLSGHSVAVELGTTNKDALDAENVTLKAAGKPLIEIKTYEADTDSFQQLALGRVDAFSTDSPVVAYYNAKPENVGKFELGGTPIAPAAIGIAVNKDNTALRDAIQAEVNAMYADGTMKVIVAKWGMTDAVVLLQ